MIFQRKLTYVELYAEKIKNFLTEFYSDSDSRTGKEFKYGRQLVSLFYGQCRTVLSVCIGYRNVGSW